MAQVGINLIHCDLINHIEVCVKSLCENGGVMPPTTFIQDDYIYGNTDPVKIKMAWLAKYNGHIKDICNITCIFMSGKVQIHISYGIFVSKEDKYDYVEERNDYQVYEDLSTGLDMMGILLNQHFKL